MHAAETPIITLRLPDFIHQSWESMRAALSFCRAGGVESEEPLRVIPAGLTWADEAADDNFRGVEKVLMMAELFSTPTHL